MKMRKIAVGFMIACSLLFSSALGIYAEESTPMEKDETVYVNLNGNGSIKEVLIVNHIATPKEGTYVDYGNYSSIENITDKTVPTVTEGKITWELPANEDGFYYVGKLNNPEIPWLFTVTYTLDGKSVKLEDLSGATGNVKIKIHAVPNQKAEAYFQNNLSMQLSLTLNTDTCKNIEAEGSTTVLAGESKTISFTTLAKNHLNADVSFDAKDLSMGGISIIMSPFSISNFSAFGDMEDGVDALLNAMDQLINGTSQLENGLSTASSALGQLSDGSQQLADSKSSVVNGMNQYQQGISALSGYVSGFSGEMEGALDTFDRINGQFQSAQSQLADASQKIQSAIGQIDSTASATQKQIAALESGLNQLSTGLNGMSDGISELIAANDKMEGTLNDILSGYQTIQKGYAEAYSQLEGLNTSTESADAILGSETESPAAKELASAYKNLAGGVSAAKSSLATLNENFSGANKSFSGAISDISGGYAALNAGLNEMKTAVTSLQSGLSGGFDFSTIKEQLSTLQQEIDNTAGLLDQFDLSGYAIDTQEYKKNMTALSQALYTLSEKFGDINGAVNNQIFGGIEQINSGIKTLNDNFSSVPKEVGTLNSGQKKIKDSMDQAFSEVFDQEEDTTIQSFAAPNKITPATVQFIGATPAVVESTTVYEAEEESETTLWQRITNLFSKSE